MFKALIRITSVAAIAGAASTTALAGPAQFTDAQYIAAARCQALMSSSALGRQDTRGIDAVMNRQAGARTSMAIDRAEEARDDAERAARHAGPYGRSQLIAERDGACQAFNGAGTMSAAATSAHPTRTN